MDTQEILNFLREAEARRIVIAKSTKKIETFKYKLEHLYSVVPDDLKNDVGGLSDEFIELVAAIRKDFYELGEISASMTNLK